MAIERESFEAGAMTADVFSEEAFGKGRVQTWDAGEVEIASASDREIVLVFNGGKLSGRYRLRSMRWYPGNRWLLENDD